MAKQKNKKWFYLASGVIVVVLAFGAVSSGLLGENLQGRLSLRSVKRIEVPVARIDNKIEALKTPSLPTPPPNPPTNNPSDEDCWTAYEYLAAHSTSEFSQWMGQTGIPGNPHMSESDILYCRDSVIGSSTWYSGNLTQNQCDSMYSYLKANGPTLLSGWMQNNNYTGNDAQYCKNTYYANSWHNPTQAECTTMYEYLKQNGVSALSSWMQTNNYSKADSSFCANHYGKYWYYPTTLECSNMYTQLIVNGSGALSSWMQANNLDASDSEYCAQTSTPQNWYQSPTPTLNQCKMMRDYISAYGVRALSDWMVAINMDPLADTQYCQNTYPNTWN